MKYCYTLLLLLVVGIACKPKPLTGKDLEDRLKEAMTDYLHHNTQPGTTVEVKGVTYYPDKQNQAYICEFDVRMKNEKIDTTGKMTAAISSDFKTVTRHR